MPAGSPVVAPSPPARRSPPTAALVLLGVGLLGHLWAAHAMGGSRTAYTHHVLGFLLILVVTGAALLGLGRRLWRSRPGRTLLVIGLVQAAFGVWIALEPMRAVRAW